jgi:hypothetical protein
MLVFAYVHCTALSIIIKTREIFTWVRLQFIDEKRIQKWAPLFMIVVLKTLFQYFFRSPLNTIPLVFQIFESTKRYSAIFLFSAIPLAIEVTK